MPMHGTILALWVAAFGLRALLCVFLLRKKLHRQFPVFFAYSLFHALLTAVLLTLGRSSYTAYFYIYWPSEILNVVLGFATLYEIFGKVFEPYGALRRVGRISFQAAIVLLFFASIVVAAKADGVGLQKLMKVINLLETSVFSAQGALLLVLFLFASYFGLSWRHHVFGLTLGFGILASKGLVNYTLHNYFDVSFNQIFNYLELATINCALLLWIGYMVSREPVRKPVELIPANELERWNEALVEMLQR